MPTLKPHVLRFVLALLLMAVSLAACGGDAAPAEVAAPSTTDRRASATGVTHDSQSTTTSMPEDSSGAVEIVQLVPFTSVTGGNGHTCAVDIGGSVVCWGDNSDGEAEAPAGSFISVSAGGKHTCGVDAGGLVVCWGDNDDGQATPPAGSFISVGAGAWHTCGLKADSSIACWGADDDGQATAPTGSFVSVSAGGGHTCAVETSGSVACWGANEDDQATPPAGSFASASAGEWHTCGVNTGGTVVCWGYDDKGQAEAPAGSFTSVSAGGGHTCAVDTGGTVVCWGANQEGQAEAPAGSFTSVSAGGGHTCGVEAGGSAACWGRDFDGQATPPSLSPAQPSVTPTATAVDVPAGTAAARPGPTVAASPKLAATAVSRATPTAAATPKLAATAVPRASPTTIPKPASTPQVTPRPAATTVPRPTPTVSPDLVVHSASASDRSVDAGEDFTFYATVENQGDGPSDSTTLHLHRSDSVQPAMYSVDGLDAGENREFSDVLTAPSSAGEFAYWACVDPVPRESNTQNNCSARVSVTVRGKPDLVVHSASVSDRSVDAGEDFTFYATVENQGDGPSDSTTLHLHRSDSVQPAMYSVDGLDAGENREFSDSLTAPSSAGEFAYWACVDPVPRESDTQNNCSARVSVAVRGKPDLVVHSASVSDRSVDAGEDFTFYATVDNQGDGPSNSTTLRLYRSGSGELDMHPVAGLDAGENLKFSDSLTVPSSAGEYDYWACVDPVPRESDTQNNCSDRVSVTVRGRPDLVVHSASVSDRSVDAGEDFTFYATVDNQGDGPSNSTTLRLYRSGSGELDMHPVAGLDAGENLKFSDSLTVPSSAGEYDYWACVDPVPRESDTQNNCSDRVSVAIRGRPDLVVHSASVSARSVDAGERFTFYATVENQGDGPSDSTALRYYRSGPRELQMYPVAGLDAGETINLSSIEVAPLSAGEYDYWACLDPVPRESDTQNNCSARVSVAIRGRPDLFVHSASVSDSNVDAGERFTFYATVENQGDGPSDSTPLRYYISGSRELDMDPVPGLDAGENLKFSDSLTAPSSAGVYDYWACAGPVPRESDTQNNCSDRVSVAIRGRPDLVVHSASVSARSVDAGERFTFYATVENQGDGASDSTRLRLYRLGSGELRMYHINGLDAGRAFDLLRIEAAPSSAGEYDYWACVDPVPRESDTQNNCSEDVTVSVTVPASVDLVAELISIEPGLPPTGDPHHVYAKAPLSLTATVTNFGNVASSSTPLRYYVSTDSSINPRHDTLVGESPVSLGARRYAEYSIGSRAPSSAGTWYYGVCVKKQPGNPDSVDDCSSGIEVGVLDPVWFDELSIECYRYTSINPFDLGPRYRIQGTVVSQVALRNVKVYGYGIDAFDRSYTVGQDDLGSMSAWQRKEFSITGELNSIYTHCEYELHFEHYS